MRRVAACVCGALRLTVSGEPTGVYACGCDACRRTTGSAFAWRARWRAEDVVEAAGPRQGWRRVGDAGRWVEHVFCPTCGALVWMEGEGLGDDVAVSAGALADPLFPPPASAHRWAGAPAWLGLPPEVRIVS